VIAGPVEATVLGRVLIQARSAGEVISLRDLREVVRESSELKTFEPRPTAAWNDAYPRFIELVAKSARNAAV
jgi:rhamnulokinase